ncbi:Nse4 C-terminal-domain-containing protein [Naematelia encephala]|uniref:Non-structural maintenance of chromosomes element 4 n=1 Tax=Naematelia encephala TaxID=71784 RepID=A0A1Y2BJR2_9TREE|nr:Nse4 C-terminal-domain-containing protein [Naematelia encephala]
MSTAGPSGIQAHPDSEPEDDSVSPNRQTQTKKRKRHSHIELEDAFRHEDPIQLAKLNAQYRAKQSEAEDNLANLANVTAAEIQKNIKDTNDLFSEVRLSIGVATLDAKVIISSSDAVLGLAQKLKDDNNAFDTDNFMIRIKTLLGLDRLELEDIDVDDEEDEIDESLESGGRSRRNRARKGRIGDWEKVGWMAASLTRRVPGVEFMYGPLAVEHKKRAAPNRQRRGDVAPEQRPEEIDLSKSNTEAKDDTLTNVRIVGKTMEALDPEGEGINLFKLVINPDSFGQTVENLFYVSFLIKEARAGITVKEDGEIFVFQRHQDDVERDTDGRILMNQAVMELDQETWEEAKRIFKITKSAIPHRDYSKLAVPGSRSWYS